MTTVTGLLLAAGAGSRMGRPKALVDDWLVRSCSVLRDGGCVRVVVVLGAGADEARALIPDERVIVAANWDDGMSASLRAGLAALDGDAALVHLVDLPDVGADVVRRVSASASADALFRATYGGVPGHPVLIGRDHWDGVMQGAAGDKGARDYLVAHGVIDVECGDLAAGLDVDEPPRLEQ
jgi:nicotine blue oxidoreductase